MFVLDNNLFVCLNIYLLDYLIKMFTFLNIRSIFVHGATAKAPSNKATCYYKYIACKCGVCSNKTFCQLKNRERKYLRSPLYTSSILQFSFCIYQYLSLLSFLTTFFFFSSRFSLARCSFSLSVSLL